MHRVREGGGERKGGGKARKEGEKVRARKMGAQELTKP
jgi:hypothetical protein